MKKIFKSACYTIAAILLMTTESLAQKISAAAVVEHHYAAESHHYKLMMLALAGVYGVYLFLWNRYRSELKMFAGQKEVK